MPRDRFGRSIDYLRLSVIDRCNLRCLYCMPLRGLRFVPRDELLSAAEYGLVTEAAVSIGFRKFRITGGEPTLRPDLVEVVRAVAAASGGADLSMTTNGIHLPALAAPLREAGLRRVNVHLDSLDPGTVERLMRFGTLDAIRAGIDAAERVGFRPIKLNAVVTRDFNDADAVALARLTIERDWHVRFIELMPFGGGECTDVALGHYVPNPETKARIEAALGPLEPVPAADPSDEARNFRVRGARGVVGFISPVSEPYCGSCNRMRLTADGKFHLCLLHDDELDVRAALRGGGGREAVAEVLLRAVSAKPTGHDLDKGISARERQMFQLGG